MPFGVGKRCAVFFGVAALVCAPPASADQIDEAFVAALAKGGIPMSGPGAAIATARTVCVGFDANQTLSVVALKLMRDTNLSPKQTGYFIGLSVAAYCPQYKDKTDTSVDWLLPLPPLM